MDEKSKDINEFLSLAKALESIRKESDQKYLRLEELMNKLGLNAYIQDPETMAVYKIIEPEGHFVSYRKISYKRTALEGERGGTVLSKKEAEENGFILKK